MALLEQALLTGLGVGAIYSLVAFGISIVWMVGRTLNFAHGDILMIGVFSSLVALGLGASVPMAVVAALVISVGLALLLQRAVFHPLRQRGDQLTWVLGVVVFTAILQSVATLVFGSRSYSAPFVIGGDSVMGLPGGAVLRLTYLWIIGAALILVLLLDHVMSRTHLGHSIRAVAHSRSTSESVGIDADRTTLIAFAMAAAVGCLAGLLVAPLTFVSVSLGWIFTLKGFTAAILGGINRIRGVLIGGLLLGLTEQLLAVAEAMSPGKFSHYLGAGYRDAIAFLVLIIVLLVRPQGLFGGRPLRRDTM